MSIKSGNWEDVFGEDPYFLDFRDYLIGLFGDTLVCMCEVGEVDEIWEIDQIAEHNLKFKELADVPNISKEGFCVAGITLGEINGVQVVTQQDACPMGIWMTQESLEKLKKDYQE